MNHEAWLEARKKGISGTDVGAILGLNKFKKPIDVYLEKRGEAHPIEENAAMLWGTAQEPLIAEHYAKIHGVTLTEPGFMVHPKYDWVIGTPDRLIIGKENHIPTEGLEVKTANSRQAHLWGPGNAVGRDGNIEEMSDDIPEVYLCQCVWYMLLTGIKTWHVAAKIDSADYREYTIKHNPVLEQRIFDICEDFWENNVLKGMPPAPDASKSYAQYIQDAHPKDTAEMITVLDGDKILATVNQLKAIREASTQIEADEELLQNIIKSYIGDAAGIIGDGWKVTWKATKPLTKIDYKKLAELLKEYAPSEVADELTIHCTETKPGSRRFLPSFA